MSDSILVLLLGLEGLEGDLMAALQTRTIGGANGVLLAKGINEFYTEFARQELCLVVMAASQARFDPAKVPFVGVVLIDSDGVLAHSGAAESATNIRIVADVPAVSQLRSFPQAGNAAEHLPMDELQPAQRKLVRALALARADRTARGWLKKQTLGSHTGLSKGSIANHTQRIREAGIATEADPVSGIRLAPKPFRSPHPLTLKSLEWAKNFGPDETALVVHRDEADERERLADWDFSIALTLGPVTIAPKSIEERPGYTVSIDISGELAIYRNRGKRFLREHFLSELNRARVAEKSQRVHQSMLDAVRGQLDGELSCTPNGINGFPYRWASGGSLLLVKWRKRWWALAFFRDIRPVGWNLANGASESTDEQWELVRLIERETFEEIILVGGDPRKQRTLETIPLELERDPDVQRRRIQLAQELLQNHHRLRTEQDRFVLQPSTERIARVRPVDGPAAIHLTDGTKSKVAGRYLYATIDPLDFGIEVIQIGRVTLPDDVFILDGEVIGGNKTSGQPSSLARRPPGLLSLSYLEKVWKNSGDRSLGSFVDGGADERRLGGKELPPMNLSSDVAETDLYIFDHDYEWRRTRSPDELSTDDANWLSAFGADFDGFFSRHETSPNLRTLCPVTWKVLEQALARGDLRDP